MNSPEDQSKVLTRLEEVSKRAGLAAKHCTNTLEATELYEDLVEDMKGNEHLILDGTPRRLNEAEVLDSAIRFYKRENPIVVSIEVSDEWATKLLKGRGRSDDNDEEIKKRLDWYHENVKQAMDYFRNNPDYNFIPINGERTIEEVHQDIIKTLKLD